MATYDDVDLYIEYNPENRCKEWTKKFKNKLPVFSHKGNWYSVTRLVYDHFNPNADKVPLSRTCGNNKCVSPEHLITRKQPVDYTKIWNRLCDKSVIEKNDKFDRDCRKWTGPQKFGYGQTSVDKKTWKVSRLSYFIANAELPDKDDAGNILVIRHMCGVPLCFEPTHLKLGTIGENMHDKKTHGTEQNGEKHYRAVLTEDIVRQIRKHKGTDADCSKELGITKKQVYNVRKGHAWHHIPLEDGTVLTKKVMKKTVKVWTPELFAQAKKKILSNTKDGELHAVLKSKCTVWTGKVDKSGYGNIYFNGVQKGVHMLMCEATNEREIKPTEVTRHLCSQSLCVNPNHLQFGTRNENAYDAVIACNNKNYTSDDKIIEIRSTYLRDGLNMKERALKYGISVSVHRDIVNYKTFKHIGIVGVNFKLRKSGRVVISFSF